MIGRALPDPAGDGAIPRTTTPPTAADLVAALSAAGVDRAQLETHKAERQAAGLPWPHPVPAELRPDIGAAQFFSALRQVTDDLEVHSWQVSGPAPTRPLTADERRLLADVPPHW